MEFIQLVHTQQARGHMEIMDTTTNIARHVVIKQIQEHVQEAHGQIIKRQVFMERNVQHVVEFIQLVHTQQVHGKQEIQANTTNIAQRVVIRWIAVLIVPVHGHL